MQRLVRAPKIRLVLAYHFTFNREAPSKDLGIPEGSWQLSGDRDSRRRRTETEKNREAPSTDLGIPEGSWQLSGDSRRSSSSVVLWKCSA